MSHHEAPQGWPTTGEQTDGSIVYPAPPNTGAEAGQMPELFPKYEYSPEENADNCTGVRDLIDRQLDTLLGDDMEMHFTVRSILAGMIQIQQKQKIVEKTVMSPRLSPSPYDVSEEKELHG
jgi:hypothetical protein